MATLSIETTVSQFVLDQPSRSRVFQQLGIDFCCGGKKSLAEACAARQLDAATVLRMLEAPAIAGGNADSDRDWSKATLTELADHIEQTHHGYLRAELPRLGAMVRKVATVHGHNFPWMIQINSVFEAFVEELASHMMKEEKVLFPIIREMEAGRADAGSHCGGVANPIRMMEHEHDNAGAALEQMRALSSDYTPPAEACNTFRAMLDGLRELEADMHLHVHKENNILFPRAQQLEAAVAGT